MIHYFEEPTEENPKFPCGIRNENISDNHNAVICSICNYKTHIKCQIIKTSYIFCLQCQDEIIPFQQLSD